MKRERPGQSGRSFAYILYKRNYRSCGKISGLCKIAQKHLSVCYTDSKIDKARERDREASVPIKIENLEGGQCHAEDHTLCGGGPDPGLRHR